MNLFVIELASSNVECVRKATELLFNVNEIKIEVLFAHSEHEFNFVGWDGSLTQAFTELSSEVLPAIQIYSTASSARVATVYGPKFGGEGIDQYTFVGELKCTLEFVESVANSIVVNVTGVTFLSVSLEEPLEVSELPSIDASIFPWNDWRLVLGGVFEEGEIASLKEGMAYRKLSAKNVK